jgi:hypothetical protein
LSKSAKKKYYIRETAIYQLSQSMVRVNGEVD